MRTRALPTLALLGVLLAGCSSEAGPTPGRQAQDPGPEAFRLKLSALSADQCFASPQQQLPKGCEKYITELGSVPGTARKLTQYPQPDPAVQDAANQLERSIGGYRSGGCGTEAAPGGGCTKTLIDIAAALGQIKSVVDRQTAGS